MIETFAALFAAHVAADFLLQTGWMAENKRQPLPLLSHAAVVLATAAIATGQPAHPALLALVVLHALIDIAKAWIPAARGALGFLLDQTAHLATLAGIAVWAPDLWDTGLWSAAPPIALHIATLVAALVLVTQGGRYFVATLMQDIEIPLPTEDATDAKGLPGGGLVIGLLERAMIFILLAAGQPAAIGFLIAAKSVLRFGTVQENRAASEYVIIGTLASFGWAIAVTLLCESLRAYLPPLEIAAPKP
ncbi:DUF3307 domain-containing protein [Psychromarinibacter sp. S121]|uniref:DUF3307 domain-containing protein n=1 Tax=Psychromarinibacter sp. S121 TaxID=3415127 RepID=UPI003C7A97E2